MAKTPERITKMADLAKLAGVSVSTASRALSGSSLINQQTREKIVALAEKHNYHVNEGARNFRLNKSNLISLVLMMTSKSHQHTADMFFLEMLGSIADALSVRGYDMLLAHTPVEDVVDIYSSRAFRNSDGLIFVGQGHQQKQLNQLHKQGVPMVVWGAYLPGSKYCTVGSDNILGGYLATSHLLALGRKKVLFIGDTSLPEFQLRYQGYQKALKEKRIARKKEMELDVPLELSHASEALVELLQQKSGFDSIVACSDILAMSAMGALQDIGVRVPEDVAVVGYDDVTLASFSSPKLTTIRQNIAQGGRVLVQKLISIIDGEDVDSSVLNTELIVRRSSGAW